MSLCCCAWTFSSCGERGLFFTVVHGLFIVVASLVAEHRLLAHGLSSCGSWVLVAPWQVESSWSRDLTCVLFFGRQIYHQEDNLKDYYVPDFVMIALDIQGSFLFHTHIIIVFLYLCEKFQWDFIEFIYDFR